MMKTFFRETQWPVYKTVSCFFPYLFVFSWFFVSVIVYFHHNARSPNQLADCISKLHLLFLPSRHLLFPQWRPRDNHTLPGCHNWNRSRQIWDKSLPVVQFAKINWQNLNIFSRLLLQVAPDKKNSDVYGVGKKEIKSGRLFFRREKVLFCQRSLWHYWSCTEYPDPAHNIRASCPTTQILVFFYPKPRIHFISLNQYELRNVSVDNICTHSLEVIMVIVAGCDVKS